MTATRRLFVTALLTSLPISAWRMRALAQDAYPTQRVRIIMPYPPGSGTDILARLLAKELEREWGQSVYVDNIGGAGGNIAGEAAAHAAPDGYTLLFVPAPPLVINQFVYGHLGYDPAKLTPISMVASVPYALVVRRDFPAASLQELIAYARANPGKATYASAGVGSTAQLAALELQTMTGIQMLHVPYRGAAPALTDVIGSQVDMVWDIVSTALPWWQSGKVKVLGTCGKTRSRIMPSVATFAESGLPGYQAVTWFAMVAPPATPDAIVDKIYRGIAAALQVPAVADRISNLGMDSAGLSPADSAQFFARDEKLWGKIISDAGIRLD
jgi:tripartite-type tricarboxylate transporter receptor subunit TctC